MAVQREIGDRLGEATSLGNLGLVADKRGDYDEAERLYRESVRIKTRSASLWKTGTSRTDTWTRTRSGTSPHLRTISSSEPGTS